MKNNRLLTENVVQMWKRKVEAGTLTIESCLNLALNSQDAKTANSLIEAVEKASRPMNTNMTGISLSRDTWERIKADPKA